MSTKTKTNKPAASSKKTAAEMPQLNTGESILGHAMLANVSIRMWEGRKHDKEITSQVTADHRADPGSGRFHKHLFGGKTQALSSIITAAAGLRGTHYQQTLPWSDSGWRLLPTANYMQYTEAMRDAQRKYREAVEEFVRQYPVLVTEARSKLRDMYRHSDYPSVQSIPQRFHVGLEFSPLPAGDDFRINLPTAELKRMAAEVEARVAKSSQLAMQEAWKRLGDVVTGLRDKLDDGKYLRESMLTKVRDVAEVLGRLNLTGDQALEAARTRVITELGSLSVEGLRDDESVRSKAAASADAILKSMAGLYVPSTTEE